MSNELATATTEPPAVERVGEHDIMVAARNPAEMMKHNAAMVDWAKEKFEREKELLHDAEEALTQATNAGLGTATLARMRKAAQLRVEFYEKVVDALEAGYVIVPNIPVDTIAIRVRGNTQPNAERESRYGPAAMPNYAPNILPPGEGKYVDPVPKGYRWSTTKEEKDYRGQIEKTTIHHAKATAWRDPQWPFAMARSTVMKAVGDAVDSLLFDEIGVSPQRRQKGDPMVIGRIRMGRADRRGRSDRGVVSFMIAWWIDTRDLP